MVGHEAAKQEREEIVDWLKVRYPKVPIVALNPPNQQLSGADYNARQNVPESWLPFISKLPANPLF